MFARKVGLVIVALVLCALSVQPVGAQKDDPKRTIKRDIPTPPADAIAGTVKSVDMKSPSFTLKLATGKDRKFLVDAKTEFLGPQGGDRGTGPHGLKDDCMAAGYEIKVAVSKDGKTAANVYLPNRKTETK